MEHKSVTPPNNSTIPPHSSLTPAHATIFGKPVEVQTATIARLRGQSTNMSTARSLWSYVASTVAYQSDFDRLQGYYSNLIEYACIGNASQFNYYFSQITPVLKKIGTQFSDVDISEIAYLAFKEACAKLDTPKLQNILNLNSNSISKCDRNGIVCLMQLARDELIARKEPINVLAVNRRIAAFQSPLHDGTLQSPMKALGHGATNTVFKGNYGTHGTFVYKEDITPDYIDPARILGINTKDPLLTARGVASYKYNQMLGFDVIIPTYHIEHEGKMGIAMALAKGISQKDDQNTVLTRFPIEEEPPITQNTIQEYVNNIRWDDNGYPIATTKDEQNTIEELSIMLNAPLGIKRLGSDLYSIKPSFIQFDSRDPILRRELVKLALLDALTQQYDRHCGNYFIEYDSITQKVVGIKGIDNDFSFGNKLFDPRTINSFHLNTGFNGVTLPQVIDTEMYDSITAITPESLGTMLSTELPEDNIVIALQLLQIVQDHIKGLYERGRVIDPSEWGSDQVSEWLQEKVGEKEKSLPTSYVERDVQSLKATAEQGYRIYDPLGTLISA